MTIESHTRPSLLVRVRDHDDGDAWSRFAEIYSPIIVNFVKRRGLQDADAADLAQDVLQSVAKAIARFEYDPQKGTFRSWLYRITRNRLIDFAEQNRRHVRGSGDTRYVQCLHELPADDQLEQRWNQEHAEYLLGWALERLRVDFAAKSIEAFERTMLKDEAVADVAHELSLSVGAVYIAKSRVLVRLKELLREVECESIVGLDP